MYFKHQNVNNGAESGDLVQLQMYQNQLDELMIEIEQAEADLRHENETYSTRGGVSLDDWKDLQRQLSNEEDQREKLNFEMKAATTITGKTENLRFPCQTL